MSSFWPSWKENRLFTVLVALLVAALVLFSGFKAWNAWSEHDSIGRALRDRDVITIEGEGKVTGKPTLAQVDIGLYSEGRDVPQVQADNARKVNAIIGGLKELGLAEADLQTSNYSISPKFDYRDGTQNVVGYLVTQNLSAKVRDLSKVGSVIAKATQLGANQVQGVNFTIDDPTEQKQMARKKAMDDARAKADELAQALGVEIVRVVTFSESSGGGPIPYAYRADAGVAAAPVPDIQPGSLDVVSHVSVTFEIR